MRQYSTNVFAGLTPLLITLALKSEDTEDAKSIVIDAKRIVDDKAFHRSLEQAFTGENPENWMGNSRESNRTARTQLLR
jgi:hypothetical protein